MDYTQRSIRQLCQLYGQADRGLEMVEGREARQKLHAEIKAISDEAQRRDEKYAELEKAHQINFDLIETITNLTREVDAAEKARTLCYACGNEIEALAKELPRDS